MWVYSHLIANCTAYKLQSAFTGPYIVAEIYGNNTVKVLRVDAKQQPFITNTKNLRKTAPQIEWDRVYDGREIWYYEDKGYVVNEEKNERTRGKRVLREGLRDAKEA